MDEKSQLLYNLLALGFEINSQEVKYGCQFDHHMFDKPNKRAFEVVTHFLLHQLDQKNASKLFRTCFPGSDKKSTQEFRKVTFNWLKKISEENPMFGFPKVSGTLLMSPGGSEFVHLIYTLSVFVLYKKSTSLQRDGVLYPPQFSKGKRAKAQMKIIQALTETNFKEFRKEMQLIKKSEEEVQLYADEQVNMYHSLQKKKKQLLQERRALLGPAATYSEMKLAEYQKKRRRNLNSKIEQARSMWNTISKCVEETAPHREVISSVLCKEGQDKKLDGSKLNVTIPAKLLDTCQEEIYQTVGTSLYENGSINFNSLVALENLSLELVADAMHQVGFPNFDKQNSWLKTRSQLHKDELAKLTKMQIDLEKEKGDKLVSIRNTENKLDVIYQSRTAQMGDTTKMGLDVPDTTLDYESHRFSADELNASKFEDISPCKEGIATKYFLPRGLDVSISTACLPLNCVYNQIFAGALQHQFRMPFLMEPNTAFENPKAFLENLFLEEESTMTHSPELLEVPSVSQPEQNSEAWEIPAAPELSSPYRPSPKKSTKKELPIHSLRKTGGHLKQGKTKRLDGTSKTRDWSKDLSSRLRDTFSISSHNSPKKKRGRLSVSLPSSPLMTYRSDDVIVQKVTSRTPEAERKLVDQIVTCTCENEDESSPLVVYETGGKSQLDRTAFISRDKISRTPTSARVLCFENDSFSRGVHLKSNDNSDESDDDRIMVYPSCGKPSPRNEPNTETDSLTAKPNALASNNLSIFPSQLPFIGLSPNESGRDMLLDSRNTASTAISSSIDTFLDSLNEESQTGIMDLSTPLFSASFDDDMKKFDIPTTDSLIALDVPDSSIYSHATPRMEEKSGSRAVELLMSTPPVLEEDKEAKKENNSILSSASISKTPNPTTPDRPTLQQFQLNLLPVPDFETPELQRFQSVLKRK